MKKKELNRKRMSKWVNNKGKLLEKLFKRERWTRKWENIRKIRKKKRKYLTFIGSTLQLQKVSQSSIKWTLDSSTSATSKVMYQKSTKQLSLLYIESPIVSMSDPITDLEPYTSDPANYSLIILLEWTQHAGLLASDKTIEFITNLKHFIFHFRVNIVTQLQLPKYILQGHVRTTFFDIKNHRRSNKSSTTTLRKSLKDKRLTRLCIYLAE